MKKPWTLIIITIIALLLIGVWLYLYFGGDKAREDVFSVFGFGETLDGIPLPDFFGEDDPSSEVAALRQLSLKPIIGFTEVTSSTTPRTIRYVEAGTGHVYNLLIDTGEEVRISNITVPTARTAVFSPDGSSVAITSAEAGKGTVLVTATSTETPPRSVTLPWQSSTIAFTESNQLLYATENGGQTNGYSYDQVTGKETRLFTLPFRESVVDWNIDSAGPHLVYPKASNILEGYAYTVTNSKLARLPLDGFGFSAKQSKSAKSILFMKRYNDTHETLLYTTDGTYLTSSITALPEKCAFVDTLVVVCAARETPYDKEFPDNWYRGETSEEDSLWFVDFENPTSHKIVTLSETGRSIDAMSLLIGRNGQSIYFMNTQDRTLWIFDRDFTSPVTDNE